MPKPYVKLCTLICFLLLAGCAPSAEAIQAAIAQTQTAQPTATPQIPAAHWAAINQLIDDGSTLSVKIETGLTYEEFKAQLVIYKSRHNVVLESVAEFLPQPVQTAMNRALLGWTLAFNLWSMQESGEEEPNEFSSWPDFGAAMTYLADDAVTSPYLQGKSNKFYADKYLKFDENISTLVAKANAEFVVARAGLLSLAK